MANDIKQSLVTGLTSSPKYVPVWYIYDDVGSKLQLESEHEGYYLSRSTVSVLEESLQDIIPRVSYDLTLVDLGSGNCSKTRFFIDELLKRQKTLTFYPVDISGEFLAKAAQSLSEDYGEALMVQPVTANYAQKIDELRRIEGPKLILVFASLIGMSYGDQVNTLKLLSVIMTDKCQLLFSADITQDREDILKAYDDDSGTKRNFIQNGISRLNREEGSDIDLGRFTHEIEYISNTDPQFMSYVVAYLQAKEDIRYPIPGLHSELVMKKGERLYLHEGEGYSCKHTIEQLRNIIEKAGLRLVGLHIDKEQHVALCQCMAIKKS